MLDFNQVAAQITAFTSEHKSSSKRLEAALEEAARRLRAAGPGWESVRARIATSSTSWLVPVWRDDPLQSIAPPAHPLPFTALAADGSQIVADRHDLALCYLINIGYVTIRYGESSSCVLRSRPSLAAPDETLLSDYQADSDPIAMSRLSTLRQIRELEGLAELIEEECAARSAVDAGAFGDGSLIFWPLAAERDAEYRDEVLTRLEAVLTAARKRRVPIVGYISQPMSKDVVNSLRVSVCPFPAVNCDRNCPESSRPRAEFKSPACAGTERVTDAMLFGIRLEPGHRSAVFESSSRILDSYSQENRIAFFYLHTGREIARVELPCWAANDPALLARVHAMCWDQAQKGDGYPVVLAEAHEQAIVRGAERAAFFHLMERNFVGSGVRLKTTQKALSKRARRV